MNEPVTGTLDPGAMRLALAAAEEAVEASRKAEVLLAAQLRAAASAFIYPGRIVNLSRPRELPPLFVGVKTATGNDRGTRIFRFESFPSVHVDIRNPTLSIWRAAATPISEKTGLAMSGRSHGANSRETVTLEGHFVHDTWDELEPDEYIKLMNDRLVGFIDSAIAEPMANRPTTTT